MPKDVKPVTDFELDRYLGQWYEIARFDHRFERNLEQVTADYSIKQDGTVRVANRGYSTKSNKWKNAIGKAKLAGDASEGFLDVSFFGPFYGPYVIFELDKGDIFLKNNESQTFYKDFKFNKPFDRAKINVKIVKNEMGEPLFKKKLWWEDPNKIDEINIHFWVKEK